MLKFMSLFLWNNTYPLYSSKTHYSGSSQGKSPESSCDKHPNYALKLPGDASSHLWREVHHTLCMLFANHSGPIVVFKKFLKIFYHTISVITLTGVGLDKYLPKIRTTDQKWFTDLHTYICMCDIERYFWKANFGYFPCGLIFLSIEETFITRNLVGILLSDNSLDAPIFTDLRAFLRTW